MVNSEDPTVLGKLSQQTLSLWVFPGNFSWAVLGGPKIEVFFFICFSFHGRFLSYNLTVLLENLIITARHVDVLVGHLKSKRQCNDELLFRIVEPRTNGVGDMEAAEVRGYRPGHWRSDYNN